MQNLRYPFLNLSSELDLYRDELHEAAIKVIDTGRYLHGTETLNFETELAACCEASDAVAVSNGLDALRLIFRAYMIMGKLQEGDEVIVPANTYIASILPLTELNLKPILVEPDEITFNLDWSKVERVITPRTKALLTVHLYGNPSWDSDIATKIANRGIIIVEDNAQAIGAVSSGPGLNGSRHTGNLAHAAAFSFYPTKNIGALGDAGAVVSNDTELINTVRAIANYGSDRRYHNIYIGWNCRMDEMQAALLRVKLRHLSQITAYRNEIAKTYDNFISNPKIIEPAFLDNTLQVWHQYIIRCQCRDKLREYLSNQGVGTDIHYATPPHKQPCYKGILTGEYPITEQLANEVVSLPIAHLTTQEATEIADIINKF
jgi:dTDP-4-amino-4,6-dideoxygalactose transaminase